MEKYDSREYSYSVSSEQKHRRSNGIAARDTIQEAGRLVPLARELIPLQRRTLQRCCGAKRGNAQSSSDCEGDDRHGRGTDDDCGSDVGPVLYTEKELLHFQPRQGQIAPKLAYPEILYTSQDLKTGSDHPETASDPERAQAFPEVIFTAEQLRDPRFSNSHVDSPHDPRIPKSDSHAHNSRQLDAFLQADLQAGANATRSQATLPSGKPQARSRQRSENDRKQSEQASPSKETASIATGRPRGRPRGKASWNKGSVMPARTRSKISTAMQRKWKDPAHAAAVSSSLRGKASWNKGKKMSCETRGRMSEARMGMEMSEETRARMSQAQKGRVVSLETRAKVSASRSGKQMSEQTKARIAASMRRRWSKHREKTAGEARAAAQSVSKRQRGRPKRKGRTAHVDGARTPSPVQQKERRLGGSWEVGEGRPVWQRSRGDFHLGYAAQLVELAEEALQHQREQLKQEHGKAPPANGKALSAVAQAGGTSSVPLLPDHRRIGPGGRYLGRPRKGDAPLTQVQVTRYRRNLNTYRKVKAELLAWSEAFEAQHGRAPTRRDVLETRIQWLQDRFLECSQLRQRLLAETPKLRAYLHHLPAAASIDTILEASRRPGSATNVAPNYSKARILVEDMPRRDCEVLLMHNRRSLFDPMPSVQEGAAPTQGSGEWDMLGIFAGSVLVAVTIRLTRS
ncbi:hypothetical protein CYMTET_49812 [Cymbomonas tetramitiformis]|uniref:Nuclease associated modular domain-containing protein n=1 Tax=Cymbomonas tetramitiformis TaxID=36881 RepID=A0AAE0EVF1_9CHLO|nr:hypothetical protein CYMTET_49812 [Cymbomonas tetramitiformis]